MGSLHPTESPSKVTEAETCGNKHTTLYKHIPGLSGCPLKHFLHNGGLVASRVALPTRPGRSSRRLDAWTASNRAVLRTTLSPF